ncbi:hypothetical protein Tco_0294295 [Tanacetum coccineum]
MRDNNSAELQEIKTTKTRKAQEGVCLWKHLLPQLWCHVIVLVDMTGVIKQRKGLIMHSWLSHLQVLTQRGLGYEDYNAVLPPYTGNFMPPTLDMSFTGLDEFVNEPVVENCKAMSSEEEPKVVRKNDDAPIIEEWVLDDEEEDVSQLKSEKNVRTSMVKKGLSDLNTRKTDRENCFKQAKLIAKPHQFKDGKLKHWKNMMYQNTR